MNISLENSCHTIRKDSGHNWRANRILPGEKTYSLCCVDFFAHKRQVTRPHAILQFFQTRIHDYFTSLHVIKMMKRNSTILNPGCMKAIPFLSILSVVLFACPNVDSGNTGIYGKYRSYSEDAAVNRYLINEDNYIQINKDNTIVYNTTINGKPKFNFKGTYTYDKVSDTLTIKWTEGKIPDKLKIELTGKDQIIKIGETFYKKINAN